MKRIKFSPKRPMFTRLVTISIVAAAFISGILALPAAAQQDDKLSLVDIVVALRSKKATLPERNKILADATRLRGITFSSTSQIESELTAAGADSELIKAIREKSIIIKTSAVQAPAPDASFFQKRGLSSAAAGDFKSALTDFNVAAELAPNEPSIYMDRGLTNFNLKDYEATVADYTKAIELDNNNAKAHFNRALSLEVMGKTDDAYKDFKRSIELDPANIAAKASVKRIDDDRAEKAAAIAAAQKPKAAEQKPETVPAEPKPVETTVKPEFVEFGTLTTSDATYMAKPVYSALARKMRAFGKVTVAVELDEEGKVTSANAIDGPRALHSASEDAAKRSKFASTCLPWGLHQDNCACSTMDRACSEEVGSPDGFSGSAAWASMDILSKLR